MKTFSRIFCGSSGGGKKANDTKKLRFGSSQRPVIPASYVPGQTFSHAHASASAAVRRAKSQLTVGQYLLRTGEGPVDWRARSHGELHKLMPPPYQSPIPMSTTKSRSEPHLSQEIPTFLYGSGLRSGPASRSTRPRPQSLSSNEWPWGEDSADIGRTVLHCFGPRDEQNIPLYRTVKLGDVDLRPDKGHSVAKEQEEQRQPTEKVGGPHTDQSQRCQRSPPSYEYGETHVPRIICPKPEEKVRFLKGGFLDSIRKAECNTDEGKLVAGKLQVKRLSSIRETGKHYPIPRKVVGIEGKATLVTIPPARGKHQEQKARNLRADGQYLGEYPNWLLREGASFPGGQQGQ